MRLFTTSNLTRAAIAAALLLAPTAGHAQLGGLKRRIGEQLTKAVTGEPQSNAAPAFSDRVLEITDARLERLAVGLRAESAAAERQRADQAVENAKADAYQKAADAYGACSEPYAKAMLRYTGMTMGLMLAGKREQSKTGAVSRATEDSLKAVTARVTKARDEMTAKCGAPPVEPSFAGMDGEGTDPESVGAKAAGLTGEQYAVLRERVAAYVRARDGRTGRYAFTAGERAAIDRNGALAGVRKLLEEG